MCGAVPSKQHVCYAEGSAPCEQANALPSAELAYAQGVVSSRGWLLNITICVGARALVQFGACPGQSVSDQASNAHANRVATIGIRMCRHRCTSRSGEMLAVRT